MTKNIGIIVGSLRKESYNMKVALNMVKLFPDDYQVQIIDISQLPLYNQDYDDHDEVPAAWQTFRDTMKQVDAVLFVTPEYNRSIPAPLKNAIDVGSRPYGESVWDGKPAAVVSASTGAIGGALANMVLRQSLVFLNMPTVQQPEVYLGHVQNMLSDDGSFKDEGTTKFLQTLVDAFVKLIEKY
ncbi:hypothetical protein IV38_GL000792 [Lactobacillus selangorensis]|uniref:NADPH-dependent FMN reductase-like domain-containing protein n=1 Tax=Lactobacillus selangorensis TaxID=81857 RepID=A0A0R2FIV7_9LACO|nr:NAD(P)H-dependent oxidoreductase [Lactobacillus selangorensis]KRN28593.1 hypothetical protein IV38_GL000792 [Lactobacillus selangorensis]KRN32997.1 hypothetical protein IV40_GL001061 [Lactobacillus selangorensis]